MSQKIWYVAIDGVQRGPFTIEEAVKHLKPGTKVWSKGMADWQICNHVPAFQNILESIPPPLETRDKQNTNSELLQERIDITYGYSFILLLLIIGYGILGFTDMKTSNFYTIIMLLTGISYVRILYGLKVYLNKAKFYSKADFNIYMLMLLSLILSFVPALKNRIPSEFSESITVYTIPIVVALVCLSGIFIYQLISFILKLFKLNGSEMKFFQLYGVLMFIQIGYLATVLLISVKPKYQAIADLSIDLLQAIILIAGFYFIRRQIKIKVKL